MQFKESKNLPKVNRREETRKHKEQLLNANVKVWATVHLTHKKLPHLKMIQFNRQHKRERPQKES